MLASTSSSIIHGLADGSATYAPADLAAGTAICLVQLAAILVAFKADFLRPASCRSSPA